MTAHGQSYNPPAMADSDGYKRHPLWLEAMALARDAYALAEPLRQKSPELFRRVRKAAVHVPASVAGALSGEADKREEHLLTARGALADLSRQATRIPGAEPEAARNLATRARALDRAVLFEFGVPAGSPSS